MPDKLIPRSHGNLGNSEEFGLEYNPENKQNDNKIKITKKLFGSKQKKIDKSEEIARQNLE